MWEVSFTVLISTGRLVVYTSYEGSKQNVCTNYGIAYVVCTDQSTYWAGFTGVFTTCSDFRLANDREVQDVMQLENQAVQLEERHHAMRQLQVGGGPLMGVSVGVSVGTSGCVCSCQWVCL